MSMTGDNRFLSREALLEKVERLERELAASEYRNHDLVDSVLVLECHNAAMRRALEFYAKHIHWMDLSEDCEHRTVLVARDGKMNDPNGWAVAESALSTDAGAKVLRVVEAAIAQHEMCPEHSIPVFREALAALDERKP